MFARRRARRREQIELGFARVLAGQVAAGLAANSRGDVIEEGGRARASLGTIGLMVRNARPDDPVVRETLKIAETATVEAS